MKTLITVLLGLTLMGCKGKDGSPGVAGAPGAPASSSIVTRSGAVTSDNFTVNVPGLSISRGDILAVYVCLNTLCVQMEIFQPGSGLNLFYAVQGSNVTLFNALSGGNNLYYITALERI